MVFVNKKVMKCGMQVFPMKFSISLFHLEWRSDFCKVCLQNHIFFWDHCRIQN